MSDYSLPNALPQVSRRTVLFGGAALLGSYLAGTSLPSFALAASAQKPAADDAQLTRFMRLSNLLVNHRLDPRVGARILQTAAADHADLPALTDALIGIAERKQATIVEDFFDDIPDGKAKDLAHWIIFAWYSGVSSAKPNARVFTFEQALTFQTTIDVVTIPSYGISGPNQWRQVTVPLSPLPRF